MFVSHQMAEVAYSIPKLDPGYRGWHFVEKQRIEPWFHVSMARPTQSEASSEVVLIDNITTLKAFMESLGEAYKMTSVQVITPGWLNGSQDWKMEHLTELWESHDGMAVRYVTRDQKQYFFPSTSAYADDRLARKLI